MPRSWQRIALAGLLTVVAPLGAMAQQVLWADNPHVPAEASSVTAALRTYRPIEVHMAAMRAALLPAPAEQGAGARNSNVVVSLPTPQGGSQRFRITQVPVMAPQLAAEYPSIKTYQGQGIDDPSAIARLDVSPNGFHAMVIGAQGTFYIDPARRFGDDVHHLVFSKSAMNTAVVGFRCLMSDDTDTPNTPRATAPVVLQRQPNGTQLKTYRLALACTPEYANTYGGTVMGALAGMVASVNRVSGVYEKEIAVRLVLVNNNSSLVFTNGGPNVPNPTYTNSSGSQMLNQNQQNIDRVIGNANYDIGHVFSTGGGGIAQKPSVCINSGKARGVTGLPNPRGDAFDIDFVAHEMGHQFNGNHTFNASTAGNCTGPNGTRAEVAAYEPGSGTTIMAYAGICSPEDVQNYSDPYFHSHSFDEILFHINGAGNCGVVTATNNSVPVPNAGPNRVIPARTPFMLTGSATDADGDALTYEWQQFDRTPNLTSINNPTGNAPLFRAFAPTTSPTRVFPRMSDIVNNTATLGERLPTYSRTMNFRFIARDNRVGGGGVDYAANQVEVVATAGPFLVMQPNTSNIIWQAGAPAQVSWDVAGTTAAPISAANVDILLSTDGGYTYPITLLSNTPNDGAQAITVPLSTPATTTARVMVRATANGFFDISNQNFVIEGNNGPTFFLAPAATTTPLSACAGAAATTSVNVGQITGFTGAVTLSAANLPAGITVTYGSTTIQAGNNTNATISAAPGTAAGTYFLTLTGVSGSTTHSTSLSFTVQPAATAAAVAQSPNAQGSATTAYRPRFVWTAVPNAVTYELEVSTSATFAAGATVFGGPITGLTTNSYQPTMALSPSTTYYWRVRAVSPCATAPYSATQTFRTGVQACNTTVATNVPRTVLANAGASATSIITISSSERVSEVRLSNLTITHPNVSDLEIKLRNPQNVEVVVLAPGTCPNTANISINLDDLAANAIACPISTGATARPANPLVALAGNTAAGNWTLTITNMATTGTARLTAWSLELCTLSEPPAAPDVLQVSNGTRNNSGTTVEAFWATSNTAGGTPTYYELQRSFGTNQNFALLATLAIPSQATTTDGAYSDFVTVSGRYFYRVRACNSAGCSAWTNEANALGTQKSTEQMGIAVYPNPSTGLFNVSIDNAQRGAVAISVTDALGRTVASTQLSKNGAALQHSLDLSKLAPGVYQLHIALPEGTAVQRLLKQ
ncbi:reprolysin-like metallopeptidase [Hymenobacter saemangeumensis]